MNAPELIVKINEPDLCNVNAFYIVHTSYDVNFSDQHIAALIKSEYPDATAIEITRKYWFGK